MDLFNYSRRHTNEVQIGGVPLGGDNPIRVQSMTTTSTDDTEASVKQAERIAEAGGEYVRLTTQGVREAENLKNIKAGLLADGFDVPIVADVHFNPHVADVAALYAEKVRINPGNYVDPARTFKKFEYTDEEYKEELLKIERQFVPFLNICKEHHTAIRIGVNHGSLSDRIMSRYGDTPEGIVESCMEFLRICKREQFNDVVISIKASNTVVMVTSVRLLVKAMESEGMEYPLHLGVTEAGDGEDGRIKSALGIGTLLADGIGDTIRVSLTEEPEAEIPVARHLVDYICRKVGHTYIPGVQAECFDWIRPKRRTTIPVANIGGDNPPVVVCSSVNYSSKAVGSNNPDMVPDYVYIGKVLPEKKIPGQGYIIDYNVYANLVDRENVYPIFSYNAISLINFYDAPVKFLWIQYGADKNEYFAFLKEHPEIVVVCMSDHLNSLGEDRALTHEMMAGGITNPIVYIQNYNHSREEKSDFQIEAAADMGALLLDGLADGIWLINEGSLSIDDVNTTAFGILQAARLRVSKTEYISCPGCGRTLYDLRSTIAKIKEATKDMRGLKIGIMGCIVNGPGEMADADYGYVGAGRGKISLYRKKECVEKNIPEEFAVDKLLSLINNDAIRQNKK
ncbi:MAG: 4-hydroxy-3-methylbut-2-en-1-yl diphosphate synthase [Prevotella sp.]|nr:4-hydroxy-3-methylbut-2-en-1-yl diphosphate synthase [Prevotella sp.]